MPDRGTTIVSGLPGTLPPEAAEHIAQWQRTQGVLDEVGQERQAQVAQWGDQPLPLGFGAHKYRVLSDQFRRECEEAHQHGELTHRHVLLEEFYEALAEVDPAKARDELIQLAAVAVKVIEDIDRAAAGV